MKRKLISFMLSVVMLVSLGSFSAFAEPTGSLDRFQKIDTYQNNMFADVSPEDWYNDNVKSVYEYGIMVGQSGTYFAAEGDLTIAETLTMASRLHKTFYGDSTPFASSEPWYRSYVDYALENGIIQPGQYGEASYNNPIDRSEFVKILSKVFTDDALEPINTVDDYTIPDVSEKMSCYDDVYKFYRAGILVGSDASGSFLPFSTIRRCEVAAIVSRMYQPSLRRSITELEYNSTIYGAHYRSDGMSITLQKKNDDVLYVYHDDMFLGEYAMSYSFDGQENEYSGAYTAMGFYNESTDSYIDITDYGYYHHLGYYTSARDYYNGLNLSGMYYNYHIESVEAPAGFDNMWFMDNRLLLGDSGNYIEFEIQSGYLEAIVMVNGVLPLHLEDGNSYRVTGNTVIYSLYDEDYNFYYGIYTPSEKTFRVVGNGWDSTGRFLE